MTLRSRRPLRISVALFYALSVLGCTGEPDVFVFDGVAGPAQASVPLDPAPSDWKDHDDGGASRLCILLTQDDSSWLSLAFGLESVGVPYRVTTDVAEAVRHSVVMAYPLVSGKVLSPTAVESLHRHVADGGTLIAPNALGGGIDELFGIEAAEAHRAHQTLVLSEGHRWTTPFDDPNERVVPLTTNTLPEIALGTYAYVPGGADVVATFDDGRAAILARRHRGGGMAVALGFDPGFFLQRAYGRRLEGVAERYANGYSPSVDVVLRLLKSIYREGQQAAVTLGVVPEGRSLAVVLSHDIDYNESIVHAVTYAERARARGIAATHFVQTKYVRDWNDSVFLDDETRTHLERLASLDMEIASHSVSHSLQFADFPVGSGRETYPEYRPFVEDGTRTRDATVLGELRVSKFLLDHLAGAEPVASFRPGHLEYPSTLPESLAATGYRHSSSMTANVALTHLPFRHSATREGRSAVDVYEFPITIEDELPPALHERLDEAVDVARRIARHGGIYVVLIHPDVLEPKLSFQEALVGALADRAWFGSLRELGDWWGVRAGVRVDVEPGPDGPVVTLDSREPIRGLTLELPEGFPSIGDDPDGVVRESASGRALVDLEPGTTRLTLRDERRP